jgi:plasmid stabilization system protein ParE
VKYRVQVSDKAKLDIDHALAWFERQNAAAAGLRWLSLIDAAMDSLQHNPERCSLASEADAVGLDLRELLVGKRSGARRLIFRVSGVEVEILRVWHSARRSLHEEDL